MAQPIRQTPIFKNENLFFDFGTTAKQGFAGNLQAVNLATFRSIQERERQRQEVKEAAKKIGDLQALAHFNHQAVVDSQIKQAQEWAQEYEGDYTSPEFQNELNKRVGLIQNMNARSQQLVKMLPEIKKRAEKSEYNTDQVISEVSDLILDPERMATFSNVGEDVDEIFFRNLDENILIKDALSEQYGKRDISRSRTLPSGEEMSEQFEIFDVYGGFDDDGNIFVDRDKIDVDWWRSNRPQVVRKIMDQLNDPNQMPQVAMSLNGLSSDDMLREAIAKRIERVGPLQLARNRKSPSLLDQEKLRSQQALTQKRLADTKAPIDFQDMFNRFTGGIVNDNLSQSRQAVATKDKQDLQVLRKAEVIDQINKKIEKISTDRTLKKSERRSEVSRFERAKQELNKLNEQDIVSFKAGGLNFRPNVDGVRQAFITLASTNFPGRDDRIALQNANLALDERSGVPQLFKDSPTSSHLWWDVLKEVLDTLSSPRDGEETNTEETTENQGAGQNNGQNQGDLSESDLEEIDDILANIE